MRAAERKALAELGYGDVFGSKEERRAPAKRISARKKKIQKKKVQKKKR